MHPLFDLGLAAKRSHVWHDQTKQQCEGDYHPRWWEQTTSFVRLVYCFTAIKEPNLLSQLAVQCTQSSGHERSQVTLDQPLL